MSNRSGSPAKHPRFCFEAGIVVSFALLLAVFGLVVQTSAGQYMRGTTTGTHDPLYTFRMQLLYFVPALVAMVFFMRVNLTALRRYVWVIFIAACVLLGCALFAIPGVKFFGSTFPGVEVNGSWRWINLGFLRLQASDVAKIALVFTLSHYLADAQCFLRGDKKKWFRGIPFLSLPTREISVELFNGLVKPCAIIGVVCALIGCETDLGTMVLCAAVGLIMLFLSGGRIRILIPAAAVAIAGLCAVVYFWPNRMARVFAFLDPEGTKLKEGYQLWQALVGFGCGGISGTGLGEGMQYRYFLPEAHTDFVFAVVGEELGFVCTLAVAIFFLLFFFAVVHRLQKIPDVYYFNLCLGASLFVVLQALINMCVVTGLLPTKGMSLPFISYGGSNLVVMFSFVGIIFNAMQNWRTNAFPPAVGNDA